MAESRRQVTLFSGAGCHLCHAARDVLEAIRGEIPFDFQEISIDGNPQLELKYRQELPVVLIDGRKRFKFQVHPEALRRSLLG